VLIYVLNELLLKNIWTKKITHINDIIPLTEQVSYTYLYLLIKQ